MKDNMAKTKEILNENCIYCFTYEGKIFMSTKTDPDKRWKGSLKTKKIYTTVETAEQQLKIFLRSIPANEQSKYSIGKLTLVPEISYSCF
jgi:hypothetical protein